MQVWAFWRVDPVMGLLLAALALLYLAARALSDALRANRSESGGIRAVGYWIPVAMLSVWSLVAGYPDVAVQLLFTTAVASLSLVLGTALLTAPIPIADPRERRLWVFVLPVALLALLAGFGARLTLWHASVFALQGLALVLLAVGRTQGDSSGGCATPQPLVEPKSDSARARSTAMPPAIRMIQVVLAIGLAVIGCWVAMRGLTTIGQAARVGPALRAAMILGPGLCVVMTGAGAQLAQQKQGAIVISTQVIFVLLNLCLLLPLLIVMSYVVPRFVGPDDANHTTLLHRSVPDVSDSTPLTTQPAVTTSPDTTNVESGVSSNPDELEAVSSSSSSQAPATGLQLPMLTWRIDAVLLVVLGLFLLPAALGRYALGRGEGVFLLAVFLSYLVVVALFRLLR